MTSLTIWEYDELTDHLLSRPDIWNRNSDNPDLWIRLDRSLSPLVDDPPQPALAVHFKPADGNNPFRSVDIDLYPLGWSEEDVRIYIEGLFKSWTAFGHRRRVEEVLRTFACPNSDLAAIAVAAIDWVDQRPKDGEANTPAVQPTLPEASAEIKPEVLLGPPPPDPLKIGTWFFRGGGWVSLRHAGGMIRVAMSVPTPGRQSYGEGLEGFVRPRSGRIEDTTIRLSGHSEALPTVEEIVGAQLDLDAPEEC